MEAAFYAFLFHWYESTLDSVASLYAVFPITVSLTAAVLAGFMSPRQLLFAAAVSGLMFPISGFVTHAVFTTGSLPWGTLFKWEIFRNILSAHVALLSAIYCFLMSVGGEKHKRNGNFLFVVILVLCVILFMSNNIFVIQASRIPGGWYIGIGSNTQVAAMFLAAFLAPIPVLIFTPALAGIIVHHPKFEWLRRASLALVGMAMMMIVFSLARHVWVEISWELSTFGRYR